MINPLLIPPPDLASPSLLSIMMIIVVGSRHSIHLWIAQCYQTRHSPRWLKTTTKIAAAAETAAAAAAAVAAALCYVVLLERHAPPHHRRDRGTHVRARTNTHHSLTYLPLSRADSDGLSRMTATPLAAAFIAIWRDSNSFLSFWSSGLLQQPLLLKPLIKAVPKSIWISLMDAFKSYMEPWDSSAMKALALSRKVSIL